MKEYSTDISKIKFEFTQEGNTLGTTSDFEDLVVEVESQLGDIKEEAFYVLKTSTGWSFDSVDEIKELLEKVIKVVDRNF